MSAEYEPRNEEQRLRRRERTIGFRRYLETRGWRCSAGAWSRAGSEAQWPLQVALYRQMQEDLEETGSLDRLADFMREGERES